MKSYWIAGAAVSLGAATFAVSLTSERAWAQSTPLHPAGSILLRLAPKPSVTLVACRWGTWQGCMFACPDHRLTPKQREVCHNNCYKECPK
jgi:hypothetical protein